MEATLKDGVEHLKTIFDMCDQDKDGCISAEDFRSIGLEHFGKAQVTNNYLRLLCGQWEVPS